MKEINELDFPDAPRYTQNHEWAKSTADGIRCGISDYAQNQLGDIVFVELPNIDDEFEQMQAFGTIEAVKAVSDMYLPLSGKICGVNSALDDDPMVINRDPYGDGWIVKVELTKPDQVDQRVPSQLPDAGAC